MSEQETILYYKGLLTFKIIGNLISEFRDKAIINGLSMGIYKRMLSAMIESVENIYKYSSNFSYKKEDINEQHNPFLLIKKENDEFLIITGNPILNSDIQVIKKTIDKLKTLNKKELKELYKEVVKNNHFSEQGGAGLGLIEIAKSGNKMTYDFKSIHNDLSYYTLTINIEK